MSTTTTAPVAISEKARLKVFNAMTPATQEVAKEFEEHGRHAGLGIVMTQYKLGAKVKAVKEDEGTYGSDAIEQLSQYLGGNCSTTYLYAIREFAATFDKEYVKKHTSVLMPGGGQLTLNHWVALAKLKDKVQREKMVDTVIKSGMSAQDLIKAIRAGAVGKVKNARQGGRNPKTPANAMVGLQQVYALSNKLLRYGEVAEHAVFDVLDEIAADMVTDVLVERIELALKGVNATGTKVEAMRDRLEKNLERAKKILDTAGEAADGEAADGEAAEKPAKKAKKAKPAEAEAEAEAPAKKAKKKLKRKVKKPAAVA